MKRTEETGMRLCRALLVGAAFLIAAGTLPVLAQKTVADRVQQFSNVVARRFGPDFTRAGVTYPPRALAFLGFKQEKRLEVYAAGADGRFRFIRSYPVLAASGNPGPKLREGDLQVPEGLYRIESLNPNSRFHLSLRINYPNETDRARAKLDKRTNLGGDIMIHGNSVSIGCLAMGDEAAEDLFVLAALTGIRNIEVVLSPTDFRVRESFDIPKNAPTWTGELHESIRAALRKYERPQREKQIGSRA